MRVSEKWFHRALWLIAFAFAGFLIGLGGLVVGNLPGVEAPPTLDSLIDPSASAAIETSIKQAQSNARDGETAEESARLRLQAATAEYSSAHETFSNWLATRTATEQADQNKELVSRTHSLETLNDNVRTAQKALDQIEQTNAQNRQVLEKERTAEAALRTQAEEKLDALQRGDYPALAGDWRMAVCKASQEPILALCLGLHILRVVCVFRRTGSVPS
jgi:hypothetical protein